MANPMRRLFRIALALAAAALACACVTSPTGRTQLLIVPPELAIVESARAYYAGVSLWRKMEAEGGARMPQFLSSHPSPANRREALSALAGDLGHLRPEIRPATYAVEIISGRARVNSPAGR